MDQQTQPISEINLNTGSRSSNNNSLSNGSSSDQSLERIRLRDGNLKFEMVDNMSLTDITLEDAVTKIREIEQANVLLRDYLKKNNDEVKKQYEALRTLKIKEKEKFEQTKAVITALRKENEELQEKLADQNEAMNKLQVALKSAEEENSRVQQLRKDLDSRQDNDVTDAVCVSLNTQEDVIMELKNTISSKEDCIKLLEEDLSKHKEEVQKFQNSAQQLLKDLESQQILKKVTDEENRRLNQELVDLNKKLHERMHLQLRTTKRELEAHPAMKSIEPHQEAAANDSFRSLLNPDSLDELIGRAQSKEEATQDENEKMKALLEKETSEKQDMEKKVHELTEKVKELSVQYSEAMQKVATIEREKCLEMNQLCQEYEAKLTEKTKQASDNQHREPANTDDIDVMRSQILYLVKEVNETQGKLSDATNTIRHKDDKIAMLYRNLKDVENQHFELTRAYQMLIQHLDSQKNAQIQSHEANSVLQGEHKQLQVSFDKLVNDYGAVVNLLDTFKRQMAHQQQERDQRRLSSENMEELNRLAAEVFAAEEALELKDEQLRELKDKLSRTDEDRDLLRIQAETFKSDFTYEREARTKIAQEKEEILEALKKCQSSNQTLKEELWEVNQKQVKELQHRRLSQETLPPGHQETGGNGALPGAEAGHHTPPPATPPQQALLMKGPQTTLPGQQPGMYSNLFTSPMYMAAAPPVRPFDARQPVRQAGPPFQVQQDHAPNRPIEEGAGDNSCTSFSYDFECPSCGALFPDIDTLHLHVPDCIDGR